jgi:hypothetical protein
VNARKRHGWRQSSRRKHGWKLNIEGYKGVRPKSAKGSDVSLTEKREKA